jgi:hypothetical protein
MGCFILDSLTAEKTLLNRNWKIIIYLKSTNLKSPHPSLQKGGRGDFHGVRAQPPKYRILA